MDNMTRLAKSYIKSLATKEDLIKLLDKLLLSDNEYKVLRLIYLDNKNINFVADSLGYSIQNVKIIHRNALLKVFSYIHSSVNL